MLRLITNNALFLVTSYFCVVHSISLGAETRPHKPHGSDRPMNISSCQTPRNGRCSGDPHDEIAQCGTLCPRICFSPPPQVCADVCLPNLCQCTDGYFRQLSDCKCVREENCNAVGNGRPGQGCGPGGEHGGNHVGGSGPGGWPPQMPH